MLNNYERDEICSSSCCSVHITVQKYNQISEGCKTFQSLCSQLLLNFNKTANCILRIRFVIVLVLFCKSQHKKTIKYHLSDASK